MDRSVRPRSKRRIMISHHDFPSRIPIQDPGSWSHHNFPSRFPIQDPGSKILDPENPETRKYMEHSEHRQHVQNFFRSWNHHVWWYRSSFVIFTRLAHKERLILVVQLSNCSTVFFFSFLKNIKMYVLEKKIGSLAEFSENSMKKEGNRIVSRKYQLDKTCSARPKVLLCKYPEVQFLKSRRWRNGLVKNQFCT